MLKFKRKKAISGHVFHKMNKHFPFGEPRDTYRYRKIMRVRAKRLDIRIRCYSCRVNISQHLGTAAPDLHLDIKGYKPYGIVCAMCKSYMCGGLHL